MNVLYEDNHIIVVEKIRNVASQGDGKDKDMLDLIKEYIKVKYDKPGNVFLGLLHRLDRPVGGLMVFAKTSKAASRISDEIRRHELKKTYLAVLRGNLKQKAGRLEDYLLKDKKNNMVKVVKKDTKGSKHAILEYEVLGYEDGLTLVKVDLKTGRPHQIRVQFSNLGYPLYGDQRYGQNVNKVGQQIALWSHSLSFKHPIKKEIMDFELEPKDEYPWNLFKNTR